MASSDVRQATALDRFAIVRLLRDAHAAAPVVPVAFSAPHALAIADRHIGDPSMLALVMGDQPQGVLLASAQDHPFGPARYAMETVWWVAPDARGRAAGAMLDAYEDWARGLGCAFCQMAALVSFPQAEILYRRRGYRAVETHFLKPLAA
ncbi:GNAT family N-acetyltransferase [Pelagibacterium limicola]|uniref:GNAT family N-acetyltransferase n=1 Tax=Pelagibacterium limicola TaxID=2791022 RepID=UPI0018AF7FD1|nr:GNAT family N-acetyltransferase [Pelagibacterium limicola]